MPDGRHAAGIVLRADDPLADRAELELGELADRNTVRSAELLRLSLLDVVLGEHDDCEVAPTIAPKGAVMPSQ